jgi:DNA gyrase subunit A
LRHPAIDEVNNVEQNNIGHIQPIDIEKEMKTSFISYAMAVIINRALPDVRDGLKPVHRRILYSMHEIGLTADKPFRKCATVVGDVLGKYHPHGDSSVYDALVRMAQDFSTRYPQVTGHGNFGSVDGDGAAAMRYTEAKMSRISGELLRDLDKDTVDMVPNFDDRLMQPSVLPARIPNLLVNGSGGIAVGMATNIPPHNLAEVSNACIAFIDNPDIGFEALMSHIKGPDFPTGGLIMGTSGIRQAYATGRGRAVVRARAEIETFSKNRTRIIVSELPYQVNKARLVEKIADMVHEKRIEGIADLRDESDRSGMRIVIELKRDINANVVLNNLYKHTQMQDAFGIIMLSLVDGQPRILTLKQMIFHYIEHRKDVVVRRTRYDLERAQARAHILEGLLRALDHIDEVIRIIRSSNDDTQARTRLMEAFDFSEKQAQAILDMRLRRLTGLESERLLEELETLRVQIAQYIRILAEPQLVLDIIKEELVEVRDAYGDERRSEIMPVEGEVDVEDLIDPQDMCVTLTHFGYIKRLPADTYRLQRRGGKGVTGVTTREEDFVENLLFVNTHTPILFFTNKGRVYRLKCYEIPMAGRTARGMAIVNLLRLHGDEKINAVFPIESGQEGQYLVMATRLGLIKKTPMAEFENIRQNGLLALSLREDDELCSVFRTGGGDEIIVGTKNGQSIRFGEKDIRPMGRAAHGVRSIDLRGDDCVTDVQKADKPYVCAISENGYGKLTAIAEYPLQTRGGKGVKTMQITDKTGNLIGFKTVAGDEDAVVIDEEGTVIRLTLSEVSTIGRSTQGVRVMRLSEGSRVAAVEIVPASEEEEEEEAEQGAVE